MGSPYAHDLGDWQQSNVVFINRNLAAHRLFVESLRGLTLPQQNELSSSEERSRTSATIPWYLENAAANVSRMFSTPLQLQAAAFKRPTRCCWGQILPAALVASECPGRLLRPPRRSGSSRWPPSASTLSSRHTESADADCARDFLVRSDDDREPRATCKVEDSGRRLMVPMTEGDLRCS